MAKGKTAEIQPTHERFVRGYGVERLDKQIADIRGAIGRPYRAVDVLMAMERRGQITAEMRAAGDDFRELFYKAHLDPMRAADMARSGGSGFHGVTGEEMVEATERGDKRTIARWGQPAASLGQAQARHAVWEALQVLGGVNSLGGSVVWFVVGAERTLRDWAASQTWGGRSVNYDGASLALIVALGVLVAHFAADQKTFQKAA